MQINNANFNLVVNINVTDNVNGEFQSAPNIY